MTPQGHSIAKKDYPIGTDGPPNYGGAPLNQGREPPSQGGGLPTHEGGVPNHEGAPLIIAIYSN